MNSTLTQIVRSPLDVIISAFMYHRLEGPHGGRGGAMPSQQHHPSTSSRLRAQTATAAGIQLLAGGGMWSVCRTAGSQTAFFELLSLPPVQAAAGA